MYDIDFLPQRYQEQTAHRRARNHSVLVVMAFAALLAAGAWGQQRSWSRLSNEARVAHAGYDQAAELGRTVSALQEQLTRQDDKAELLTFLRHPWPRSKILADVIAPLPETISIDKLQISRESLPSTRQSNLLTAAQEALAPSSTDSSSQGAVQDLKRLREEIVATQVIVRLDGRTRDHSALHVYLHELRKGGLIERAELLSLEQASDVAKEAQFSALLTIMPGHGLPGGPGPRDAQLEVASKVAP